MAEHSPREEALFGRDGPLRVHVVGAGGAAMSAIATVLASMGHRVSGSDLRESPQVARLRAAGIPVAVGHGASNVGDADVVAVSSAIPDANLELVEARRRGIPVLSRSAVLSELTTRRRTVAVAGTHGKTTTSSMLALVLQEAGWCPSYLIGGEPIGLPGAARWAGGPWLVAEADESDGTFLALDAEAGIVTSVEPDHLDHYGGFEGLIAAFGSFVEHLRGPAVLLADDPVVAGLAAGGRAITFGTSPGASWRVGAVEVGRFSASFELLGASARLGRVELSVPGRHNVMNAAAALVMALALGVDAAVAVAALARFGGVARRFQPRGERDGVSFVEDYAHLPGEVRAALATAAEGGWDRIVCVFQPHRYSRTAALWREFAGAFDLADVLVVGGIYAADEPPVPGVSGELVAEAVRAASPGKRVVYEPERSALAATVAGELRGGDLCLVLGAGDVTELPAELEARGPGDGATCGPAGGGA